MDIYQCNHYYYCTFQHWSCYYQSVTDQCVISVMTNTHSIGNRPCLFCIDSIWPLWLNIQVCLLCYPHSLISPVSKLLFYLSICNAQLLHLYQHGKEHCICVFAFTDLWNWLGMNYYPLSVTNWSGSSYLTRRLHCNCKRFSVMVLLSRESLTILNEHPLPTQAYFLEKVLQN